MDEQNIDKQVKKAQQPAELSDQELDQVAGGTKWTLSELDAAKNIKGNIKADDIDFPIAEDYLRVKKK